MPPPPISAHSIAGIPPGKSDASGGIDFPGGIPAYTIEQRSGGPVQSVVGGGGLQLIPQLLATGDPEGPCFT